jgi:DNA processing protein
MLPQHVEAQTTLPASPEEQALLRVLSHENRHIDDIIREVGLPAHTVSALLTVMELKGMIRQVGGMHYILAR